MANNEICSKTLIIRPKLKKTAVRYQKTSDNTNDTRDTEKISTQLGSRLYYETIGCTFCFPVGVQVKLDNKEFRITEDQIIGVLLYSH
jgi:hypothetical protein